MYTHKLPTGFRRPENPALGFSVVYGSQSEKTVVPETSAWLERMAEHGTIGDAGEVSMPLRLCFLVNPVQEDG